MEMEVLGIEIAMMIRVPEHLYAATENDRVMMGKRGRESNQPNVRIG